MNQLQKHCTAEMNRGIYPPSLKFLITYDYEIEHYHKLKQRTHTVSVTGCDKEDEVTFGIKVFELPGTPPGMVYMFVHTCVCIYVFPGCRR